MIAAQFPELSRTYRSAAGSLALVALLTAAPAQAQEDAAVDAPEEAASVLSIPLAGVLGAQSSTPEPDAAGDTPRDIEIPLEAGLAVQAKGEPGAADEGATIELFGPTIEAAARLVEPQIEATDQIGPVAALWPLDTGRVSGASARFRGERDSVEFSLFVPPGRPPEALTIAAVSSAFILPRRSILRAFIGDELVGEMPLQSITQLETARFPVPAGRLQPGLNVVRIEVDLAHRLYCGAQASYDLWTSVDLSRSGVEYDLEAVPQGPEAFLAAASVARGAGTPILLRGAQVAPGASREMRDLSRQLGRMMGGGLTFTARVRPVPEGALPPPVIEIRAVGTPGVAFSRDADGGQIMVVRAGDGDMPALFGGTGVADAIAALPTLPRERPVPISALGFETTRISQHLWTEEMAFRLPQDWLINVKERAVLDLAFGYLSGLPTGAEFRIIVNGEVVRIVPLDRGGRLEEEPLEVRFDAGLLRAGRNVIGFEVNVPGDPADAPCLTADVGRIEVRETSSLLVPSSPRMHMPGLGRWMSGGGDLIIEAAENAAISDDIVEQWELYLGLAAAMHGGSGGAVADDATRRLFVLRPTDLSRAAFGEFSIGRQAMLLTLQPPRAAPRHRRAGTQPEGA